MSLRILKLSLISPLKLIQREHIHSWFKGEQEISKTLINMSLQIRGFGLISPLKLIRRGHIGNCFKREYEVSKCKEIMEAFDMDSVQFLMPLIKITTKNARHENMRNRGHIKTLLNL